MTRNLKVRSLALLLCTLGAATAFAAPAAQASPEFTGSSYPFSITGEEEKGVEEISTEAGKVECASHFAGKLSESSSTLTLTPVYSSCSAFGFVSATVNPEGCEYLLHAGEGGAGTYSHNVDIVCPSGQSIKITASTCKAEIPAQTGLTSAETQNQGSSVWLNWQIFWFSYTVTQDGFLCPFNKTGIKFDGWYAGGVVLSGTFGGTFAVTG